MFHFSAFVIDAALATAALAMFGFGNSSKLQEQPLDPEEVAQRLRMGLSDLSDADRRNLGLYRESLEGLTVEQAILADKIAESLSKK